MKRGSVVSIGVFLVFGLLVSVISVSIVSAHDNCESSGGLKSINPFKFILNFLFSGTYFDDVAYLGDDTFEETLPLEPIPGPIGDMSDLPPPTPTSDCDTPPDPISGEDFLCGVNPDYPYHNAVLAYKWKAICRGQWIQEYLSVPPRIVEDCGPFDYGRELPYCGDEGNLYQMSYEDAHLCQTVTRGGASVPECFIQHIESTMLFEQLPPNTEEFIDGECIDEDTYQRETKETIYYCDSSLGFGRITSRIVYHIYFDPVSGCTELMGGGDLMDGGTGADPGADPSMELPETPEM